MPDIQTQGTARVAHFGEVSLDFGKMQLCRDGQRVVITAREFKVLKFLISRPEVVVSRQKLISAAFPKRERSTHRTVDNCIARLRRKIERDPTRPIFICTVHGVGYKFVPQEEALSTSKTAMGASPENI
jgi:DNA-binding response OmpR family regulator